MRNWRDVARGKQIPQESLRKFGGQVDDWRRVGEEEETRSMLRTLKALVEEFDPERVEVDGWVITFRDTSKVDTRCSGWTGRAGPPAGSGPAGP